MNPDQNLVEMDPFTRSYHGRGNAFLVRTNVQVVKAAVAELREKAARAEADYVKDQTPGKSRRPLKAVAA